MPDLLTRIERYYDMVPRSFGARVEEFGPLTLFVYDGGPWPLYARPSLGADAVAPTQVEDVRRRMRELGVPESFEWVDQVTPALRGAALAAGLAVSDHPLLALTEAIAAPAVDAEVHAEVRAVGPDDDLAAVLTSAHLGFASRGTAVGSVGLGELVQAAGEQSREAIQSERDALRSRSASRFAAWVNGSPVCTGRYTPLARVAEIVGVGTLPAYRRRGLAGAVTAALTTDALAAGVEMVFLSADDEDVARVYRRLGFADCGTACIAAPPTPVGR